VADDQRWYLRRRESASFLQRHPDLDPLVAKVLYARKIDTPSNIRAFLGDDGEPEDPFRMADMDRAVARLQRALRDGERIAVYGDFDADGVSATALLVCALRALAAESRAGRSQVSPYIPDRFSESYGLNIAALDRLRRLGASLVVTVDCGIRSCAEVAHAQAHGLDVIITDHHSVPQELPPAVAVIDPKRPDSGYSFRELAGVGVAHRLVEALCQACGRGGEGTGGTDLDLDGLLDLVALGTVSDVVPLTGENRALVRRGLRQMRASPRQGLDALMQVAGIRDRKVDSSAIAFRLGPRVNAAGRLRSAMLAYDLLVAESAQEAAELAETLNEINSERHRLLARQVEMARSLVGDADSRGVLIIADPQFHEGIVGLVASRLTDEFYRPSLVMRPGDAITRGSARSVEGFHITQALDFCSDLLLRYGGHARAAGFSLPNERLGAFRRRLLRYGDEHLTDQMLTPRHQVDAIVPLEEIQEDTPEVLSQLGPFGEGNPEPSFATLGLRVLEVRRVGQEGGHLRLTVTDGNRALCCIAFRQGHQANSFSPGDAIDLIYSPDLNEWQGETSLQLVVEAMRRTDEEHPAPR